MGLERVYFNDRLILLSIHRGEKLAFEVDNTQYRIEFCTRSVSMGKMLCSFYINGELTHSLLSTRVKVLNTRPVLTHIGACAAFGAISGLLHLPLWAGLACIMISFAVTLLTTAKKDEFVIRQYVPDIQHPATGAHYPQPQTT